MRRYIKKQCFDTLILLEEAQSEIKNYIERHEDEAAVELLGQCQEGAVAVGNMIEDSEGEGTAEVALLEEYCELAWKSAEKISSSEKVDVKKYIDELQKITGRIKDGIENRIPGSREIVFLPYKASMWDSLEPVWKKFSIEKDISTVVIPIPYFDKNPDGSLREMHYEGNEFPSYVPITDYKTYNIEEKHPEAIYIHNPYDGMNFVTSIHPDFYSSRIKKFTDELVYIPYFVLEEISPQSKASCEGIKHFVTVPGVIHAHKVIVQSENMRQAYINIMTECTGEDTRDYWEKKIDGSGSPKLERVKNLTENDYLIPPEWEKIIKNEDGSRKKIILYNTSIAAFLQSREFMLEKIERTISFFRDHKDEVSLLWRPHPLLESTLASMHPELLEKYKMMVDNYRSEGWGIYDDTAELDRAIAVSDAYYGDPSSVVNLYKQTGKPIMIQNVYV